MELPGAGGYGDLGAMHLAAGQFFVICRKKNYFNTIESRFAYVFRAI